MATQFIGLSKRRLRQPKRFSMRQRRKAEIAGVAFDLVHVPDQHPAEGIIATAEKAGADLIVMGSHGRRTIGRLLLGSRVSEVLVHSKVPVLTVR